MNISYHAWKTWEECPKKYFLKYRKREPSLRPRNDYYTLYGRLVESFFTLFCNQWRYKTPFMPLEEIRFKLEAIYKGILENSVVDWDVPFATMTQQQILEKAVTDVHAIMDSENQNYFFNTRSEIYIAVSTSNGANVTGRLDFIHKGVHGGILIFDGKGTNKIGKNIDKDQLLWYALLYRFHFKTMPDELGFFYYQFNTMKPVDLTMAILDKFRAKLSLGVKAIISASQFEATPSTKACKYCDYADACDEGNRYRVTKMKPSKLELPETEGVLEFGL